MNDLIYRDQAIEAISKLPVKVDNLGYTWMIAGDVLKQIDDIPSTEPERKWGEWIDGKPYVNSHWRVCSVCHECAPESSGGYNFCPHCGADMRGDR